jgi:hypothetical protein
LFFCFSIPLYMSPVCSVFPFSPFWLWTGVRSLLSA